MALTKVLVTVKTYPTLSEKYDELVCTAGFREDGTWVRIFPVPFRKLNPYKQYKKYDWIEVDLEKNQNDLRPESFRPVGLGSDINVVGHIDTGAKWEQRKEFVLQHVYTNMTDLLTDLEKHDTSLAVVKANIMDFTIKPCEREWNARKLAVVKALQNQLDLFEKQEVFETVKKVPYEFSYVFSTDDGVKRTLMIEDWELGMLYFHSLKSANGDESIACQKVKKKYYCEMALRRDLYLFLGTTKRWHKVSPNPFIVIGTFYPPKSDGQLSLFE